MELKFSFKFVSSFKTDPADTGKNKIGIMEKIQLIGYGWVDANKAKNIKPGDTLIWNYGVTSVVESIEKETPKQIVIKERYKSGKVYSRRMGKERLVCIVN